MLWSAVCMHAHRTSSWRGYVLESMLYFGPITAGLKGKSEKLMTCLGRLVVRPLSRGWGHTCAGYFVWSLTGPAVCSCITAAPKYLAECHQSPV